MGWKPWSGVRGLAGLFALAAGLALASPAHADLTYIYDALGRLRAVIDPSQTDGTAIYSYDAVGNLLSITRQPASQVAIIEFSPASGPVGTTVTIQGTGFSPTPSQNAVTFNGVAATVSSATTTQLVATVPSGATTGPIAVTAPGGSATSAEPFTVTADAGAPTITSFTPTLGPAGTSVTITGTNFDPTIAANQVTFVGNGLRAVVASATSTTLGTVVPPGAVSGRLKVATPAGSAVSTQDFFVPVGSYTAADVVTTVRMAIGETQTISIPTANKIALVIFDGTASQRVFFRFTGPLWRWDRGDAECEDLRKALANALVGLAECAQVVPTLDPQVSTSLNASSSASAGPHPVRAQARASASPGQSARRSKAERSARAAGLTAASACPARCWATMRSSPASWVVAASRSVSERSMLRAIVRSWPSSASKRARERRQTVTSVCATTVAVRVESVRNAISPKCSPGPSTFSAQLPFDCRPGTTWAHPDLIT